MSIEKYLNEKNLNKVNLKKHLARLAATGLVVGTLATGMTACDNTDQPVVDGTTEPTITTTAPVESTIPVETIAPIETTIPEETTIETIDTTTEQTTVETTPAETTTSFKDLQEANKQKFLELLCDYNHNFKNGISYLRVDYNNRSKTAKVDVYSTNQSKQPFRINVSKNDYDKIMSYAQGSTVQVFSDVDLYLININTGTTITTPLSEENLLSIINILHENTTYPEPLNYESITDEEYTRLIDYLTSIRSIYKEGISCVNIKKTAGVNNEYTLTLYPMMIYNENPVEYMVNDIKNPYTITINQEMFNELMKFEDFEKYNISGEARPKDTYEWILISYNTKNFNTSVQKQFLDVVYSAMEKELPKDNTLN